MLVSSRVDMFRLFANDQDPLQINPLHHPSRDGNDGGLGHAREMMTKTDAGHSRTYHRSMPKVIWHRVGYQAIWENRFRNRQMGNRATDLSRSAYRLCRGPISATNREPVAVTSRPWARSTRVLLFARCGQPQARAIVRQARQTNQHKQKIGNSASIRHASKTIKRKGRSRSPALTLNSLYHLLFAGAFLTAVRATMSADILATGLVTAGLSFKFASIFAAASRPPRPKASAKATEAPMASEPNA